MGMEGRVEIKIRVGRKKARTGSGETLSASGTTPLKPKEGLNGPPALRSYSSEGWGVTSSGRCKKIDFAEIWLDAKCMPMAQRSLIGHPGEIFFVAELTPHLFFNFFTSSCPFNVPGEYQLRIPPGQKIRSIASGGKVPLLTHSDGSIGITLEAKRNYRVEFA
jgi:hypothetical protein